MLHSPRRKKVIKPEDFPIRLFGKVGESIVDGPGLRFAVFVQGCPHGCPGCHNPGSHSITGGIETTTSLIWREIEPLLCELDGITFSGGEPFLWGNELSALARAAHEAKLNVMTYTGYTYEALLEKAKTDEGTHNLLSATDYLVDGPFIEKERDLTLKYRGSRNQRILDVTCYPNSQNARAAAWA